jgi:hypothetical protein
MDNGSARFAPRSLGRVLRSRRGERQRRHLRWRCEEPRERQVEAAGEGGDLADIEVALAFAVERLLDRRYTGLLQLVAEVQGQLVAGLILRPALLLAGAPEVVGDHLVDADRLGFRFGLRTSAGQTLVGQRLVWSLKPLTTGCRKMVRDPRLISRYKL